MNDEIFIAIHRNDANAVSELIEREPEAARARNHNGVSALMQAVYEGQTEIVALLCGAVGDLDLYQAAAVGDVARLHTLLGNEDGHVNSRSSDGFTPLHLACFFRHPEAAQTLLAAGADADAVSGNGIAVLHSAAASNETVIVKLILAAGADPNVRQQGGYTALQAAAMNKNAEMVSALLQAGADRAIRNDEGLTAAEMAAKDGQPALVNLLR